MVVTWKNYDFRDAPAVTSARIEEVEGKLGLKLPSDYLAVAKAHQGASPRPGCFDLEDGTGGVVGHLLHFQDEPVTSSILWRREPIDDALPKKVLPFAEDGGGNLLCFDYRADATHPTVVFWDHESHDKDVVQPVADSFTDLLSKLYE